MTGRPTQAVCTEAQDHNSTWGSQVVPRKSLKGSFTSSHVPWSLATCGSSTYTGQPHWIMTCFSSSKTHSPHFFTPSHFKKTEEKRPLTKNKNSRNSFLRFWKPSLIYFLLLLISSNLSASCFMRPIMASGLVYPNSRQGFRECLKICCRAYSCIQTSQDQNINAFHSSSHKETKSILQMKSQPWFPAVKDAVLTAAAAPTLLECRDFIVAAFPSSLRAIMEDTYHLR